MNCAFCDLNNQKLTREHVIPDGFIRGMNREVTTTWSDKAPVRVFKGDIVIKDVCAKCNNGILSTLDNYAIKAITKYNGEINENTKKIFFKYDFDHISRWLLKVLYNSARSSNSIYDSNVYKECAKYILEGGTCKVDFSVYMQFIDLKVNKSKDELIYHFDKMSEYSVDHFRISSFRIKGVTAYNCPMRLIIINSFVFFIIVYTKNTTQEEKVNIEASFQKYYPRAKKLIKETKKMKLPKENTFWKMSLLSNIDLRENFLKKREKPNIPDLTFVQLSKEDLQNKDYQQIIHFIESKKRTKDSTLDYFQKFDISISGYDEDSRELWEITEFREYVKKLIEFFPDIIWFLNLQAGFFPALVFAYVNTDNSLKKSDVERVTQLLTKCFKGINEMTHSFSLDHSYNIKITELFQSSVFNVLGIKY